MSALNIKLAKICVPYWLWGDGDLRLKIVGCQNDLLHKTYGSAHKTMWDFEYLTLTFLVA